MRYADDFSKSCELTCSNGYHFNDTNQKCVANCSVLLDSTSNKCVEVCPRDPSTNNVMYANLVSKTCVLPSGCPASTYASDDLLQCVSTCPSNTYIYLTKCVTYCPNGYYKDNINRKCVVPNNCPSGLYADDLSISCVSKCPGNFADTTAKKCVNICSGSTYGDFLTGLCQNNCSTGYVINSNTHTCVSDCQLGLFKNPANNSCSSTCLDPYFADSTTNTCVSVCTSNPLTFASTSNGRVCTPNCLST
jgi:proprotein convertase subtilisin/kexin type 5